MPRPALPAQLLAITSGLDAWDRPHMREVVACIMHALTDAKAAGLPVWALTGKYDAVKVLRGEGGARPQSLSARLKSMPVSLPCPAQHELPLVSHFLSVDGFPSPHPPRSCAAAWRTQSACHRRTRT